MIKVSVSYLYFVPAFFDVTELTEVQRNNIAFMITSCINENRMRSGAAPPMQKPVKPKYFLVKKKVEKTKICLALHVDTVTLMYHCRIRRRHVQKAQTDRW